MIAELDFKDIAAATGFIITVAGYALYIRSILAGATRPGFTRLSASQGIARTKNWQLPLL